MTEIYLLRHGATEAGAALAGSTDLPLAADATDDLRRTAQALTAIHFDQIWSSPLLRCRQTLEIVLPGARAEIVADLREVDFGQWEMRTFAEIIEQYPADMARLAAWERDFAFPGGEKMAAFLARCAALRRRVAALDAAGGGEKILLVTHGGVIRQLLCAWLGNDARNYLNYGVQAGRFTTVSVYGDGGVLTGFNLGRR
ncbi:MAG: histidine phosphatase family protein [Desulfobulbaceae bacterium]|jgi:broad specificity phosphatase PhoE|nr:histidine phosphatase family protein [Desulfobulbaceae bacterium]